MGGLSAVGGYQLLRCARGAAAFAMGPGGDRKWATTLSPRSASGESEEPVGH